MYLPLSWSLEIVRRLWPKKEESWYRASYSIPTVGNQIERIFSSSTITLANGQICLIQESLCSNWSILTYLRSERSRMRANLASLRNLPRQAVQVTLVKSRVSDIVSAPHHADIYSLFCSKCIVHNMGIAPTCPKVLSLSLIGLWL